MKKHRIVRKLTVFLWKLARSNDRANEIALGAAIGTFISVFPTFGFGTLLVLVLSKWIKFNLLIAFAASFISNPLTTPFFLLLSFKVGTIILGNSIEFTTANWKKDLNETGLTLLVGSLIVSGIMGCFAYVITKYSVENYRRNIKK